MAQWVQLYEINLPLVASIAKAVEAEFGNYDLYLTHQSDLLILAAADGRPPAAGEADWSALDPALTALLDHVDVRQAGDLRLRYLGSRLQLAPFFANFGVPPNSEFHPYLDQHAVRERFLKSSALALGDLAAVVPRLTHAGPFGAPVSESRATTAGLLRWGARSLLEYARWSMHRTDARPEFPVNLINAKAAMLLSVRYFCDDRFAEGEWLMAFREWAWEFAPYLSTQETIEWLELLQTRDCDTPLPVVVQAWFGLVASSMIGDLTGVHAFAGRIEAAWPAGVPLPRVLVRESLLAWIRAGDVAAAQAALRRWSGRMPDHIEVDYLRSLIPEE